MLEGGDMATSKIDDVNKITLTSTVWSIVIITKDFEFSNLALSNADNYRHDVVRNAIRIFADETRWMIANWIKIA